MTTCCWDYYDHYNIIATLPAIYVLPPVSLSSSPIVDTYTTFLNEYDSVTLLIRVLLMDSQELRLKCDFVS